MEKTGKEANKIDSLPLRFGSFAMEFVSNEYSRAIGLELLHDESAFIHPEHPMFNAHIDRLVLGNGISSPPTKILECKTANTFAMNDWGEGSTDEVPLPYLFQVAWYQAITGIYQADLAVLLENSDFRIYEIARDKELEELIIQKALHFWNEYVLKDVPTPPQSEADCQSLFNKGKSSKSIKAQLETLELTRRLQLLNGEIEVREEEISLIKQNIMSQMGEAETLNYQGKVLVTWRAPKLSFRIDSKRLELEHPELAMNYKTPVRNSRRLVIKQIS